MKPIVAGWLVARGSATFIHFVFRHFSHRLTLRTFSRITLKLPGGEAVEVLCPVSMPIALLTVSVCLRGLPCSEHVQKWNATITRSNIVECFSYSISQADGTVLGQRKRPTVHFPQRLAIINDRQDTGREQDGEAGR